MRIQIKPYIFYPDTMIRLLYERVPKNKQPHMQHLDDPVIEYIPLSRQYQDYDIENLPMGKYIVCGEAQNNGSVTQANCFQTLVDRLDNNISVAVRSYRRDSYSNSYCCFGRILCCLSQNK